MLRTATMALALLLTAASLAGASLGIRTPLDVVVPEADLIVSARLVRIDERPPWRVGRLRVDEVWTASADAGDGTLTEARPDLRTPGLLRRGPG